MPEKLSSEDASEIRVHFYIGDDLDAMAKAEAELIKGLGNPDMAAFNITRLNGNADDLDELIKNISLFPFGTSRRLVFYSDPVGHINAAKDIERWKKIIENVPPSAELVLEFPASWVKKNKEWMWDAYAKHIWLKKWTEKQERWFSLTEFRVPSKREMPARIKMMVEEEGGSIDSRAAEELAVVTGDDIILLRQEVKKLCLFANREHPISVEDIRLLCSAIPEEDVFSMVDAFALGDASKALHQMKLMFANQDYVRVFAMVVRQFRLLLMVKEALQESKNADVIAKKLHENPFVVRKLIQQSQRFSFDQLEEMYRALYDLDGDVKRGVIQLEVGLEMIFFEKSSRAVR